MQIRSSYGGGKSSESKCLSLVSCYQTNTGVGEKNGKGAINPSSNKLDQQIEMYPRSIKSM